MCDSCNYDPTNIYSNSLTICEICLKSEPKKLITQTASLKPYLLTQKDLKNVRFLPYPTSFKSYLYLIKDIDSLSLKKHGSKKELQKKIKINNERYEERKKYLENQKNDRRNNLINELKLNGIELRDDSIICKNYIDNGEKDGNSLYGIVDIMTEMKFYCEKTSYKELLQSTRRHKRRHKRSNGNYLDWLPEDEENLRKLVKERCLKDYVKLYVKDPYKMELEVPNILKKRINDLCEKLMKLSS